jgi:thiol-disulfide isomerase/thioredoxin
MICLLHMKPVTVVELSSPGCAPCEAFAAYWQTIKNDWPNVTLRSVEITTPEGSEIAQKYMIMSAPGIIINDELWATGGFDGPKFSAKLKELSS